MSDYTLLLIDYEPRSIERMRRPLEQAGIRVEVATDGAAGLEAFERLRPDAVIIEAMLPKRHGFEVCQEIKRSPNGMRTPVIVTTGVYKGRRYRTQAMHIHGADEYLEKPLTDEQIVQTVKRFLAERRERPERPTAAPAPPSPSPLDLGGEDSDLFEIIDESLSPSKSPAAAARQATHSASVPSTPAPTTRIQGNSLVGDLTEDEISARLDALLPTDPAASTEVSWESGRAVGHLESQPESQANAVALAGEPVVEPIRDIAAEILAEFPPMPEVDGLPEAFGMESGNLDLAPPRAEAQVFSFEAGRSHRRRGREAADAPPSSAPLAERSHGSSAVAPVVEIAQAPAVAPYPAVDIPLTESYETPKPGLPIWVWAVAIAGLSAGLYFAFFRTTPSAADPAPTATIAPIPAPATPTTLLPATPPANQQVEPAATAIPAPTAARPQPPTAAAATPRATEPVQAAAAPIQVVATPPPPAVSVPVPSPPAAASDSLEDPSLEVAPVAPAVAIPAPAKPATRAGDLVSLNEVDSPPIGIDKPAPRYTTLARTRRQEGTVVFEVLVTEAGRVADVRLIRGIAGSDLNDAALTAARSWVYKPAEKDGVPVRVWRPEQVRFKL